MITKVKNPSIPRARFPSTVAAQAPSNQKFIENGGPIHFPSRLEEGRALAQDVWSIYKSVSVAL